jgi:ribosome-associated translation inhibitor RaiA
METSELQITIKAYVEPALSRLERIVAHTIYLRHYAENREKNLGLSESDVIVNAMIEFKNTDIRKHEKEQG